jgi:predicted DNA-binding protein YlxM (UPF0122 family)
MSSNFTVQRMCEHCKGVFNAKTTVTRFCSRLCNRRSNKLKQRNNLMVGVDLQVASMLERPIKQLQARDFLSVGQTAKLLGTSETMVYNMINGGRLWAVNLSKRKTIIQRKEIDGLFEDIRPTVAKDEEFQRFRIKDCYQMAEAQAMFNVSEAGLYNLIKRHKIAKYKKGWFTYVSKLDLDRIFMLNLHPCQK